MGEQQTTGGQMGTRVVIYAAKSTEDKHNSIGGKDDGERGQLDDCRDMAERMGWEVVGEFIDEAFSAYHGNRGPGLAQAKATAIEHAPCVLVAQDADRFARGAGDRPGAADHLGELFFAMRRQGVALWSVRTGELDDLHAVVLGNRAHDETARKAQAVKVGIERRKARGQAWGEPPLGYAIEHDVVEGRPVTRRVVDPINVTRLTFIFSELDSGASTGDVARKLNRAGHRSKRGNEFTARQVRRTAENPDYMGDGPYPELIDRELWERVNAKIKRDDPAAVQNRKQGRAPKADFMLRRLCFCGECGQAMYSIVHHGKRLYRCKASQRQTGTCDSLPIPAEVAELRIFEHLTMFVGDIQGWIGQRLEERSEGLTTLQKAMDEEKAKLAELDAKRDQRMAELVKVGITSLGLEVIERIDQERKSRAREIENAEAQLAEWTASLSADAVLDFYNGVVDVIQGRVAKAQGIAEVNQALHDSLLGVWLGYDGKTLSADIRLRPTGDDDIDAVVAELFGSLAPQPGMIDWQLSDHAPTCEASRQCSAGREYERAFMRARRSVTFGGPYRSSPRWRSSKIGD
jgi:DNA invertase Pin-like site-specific DNA recombinase